MPKNEIAALSSGSCLQPSSETHPLTGRMMKMAANALELVLGRDLALNELGGLATDLGQLLADLGLQILVDLQDLQLGFRDLAPGLSDGGDERTALAFETRGVALERRHALELHEVLAPQIADAFELLGDQLDLPLLRLDLIAEAVDLLL